MKRVKKAAKYNQLQETAFRLLQKVFAKQRGYVHWPAVIVDFHPIKSYTAKVEFFGWKHQWAWISFNNLLEPKAAEKIIQNSMHRAKFARAVNEMNIWRPPVVNMKVIKEITSDKENVSIKTSNPERLTRSKDKKTVSIEPSNPEPTDESTRLTRSKTKLLATKRVLRPRNFQPAE